MTKPVITAVVKGIDALPAALRKEQAAERRALNTAIRVTGYNRMRELKAELRRGRVAGRRLEDLSYISRAWWAKGSRMRGNTPLARMAKSLRYDVTERDPIEMRIGWPAGKVSKSWRKIAEFQQAGGTRPVTDTMRRSLVGRAAALSGRSLARKYLFLRKSTRRFETPARPVLAPFWRATLPTTRAEIRATFRKKLLGERI